MSWGTIRAERCEQLVEQVAHLSTDEIARVAERVESAPWLRLGAMRPDEAAECLRNYAADRRKLSNQSNINPIYERVWLRSLTFAVTIGLGCAAMSRALYYGPVRLDPTFSCIGGFLFALAWLIRPTRAH